MMRLITTMESLKSSPKKISSVIVFYYSCQTPRFLKPSLLCHKIKVLAEFSSYYAADLIDLREITDRHCCCKPTLWCPTGSSPEQTNLCDFFLQYVLWKQACTKK